MALLDAGDPLSTAAAWYGAGVATVVAVVGGIRWLRARKRKVALRLFLVHPADGGPVRLHVEAVNTGERKVSPAQYHCWQEDGTDFWGSPYEGRVEGPGMLEPDQLHGWEVPVSVGGLLPYDPAKPVHLAVKLTTGETFEAEPIG